MPPSQWLQAKVVAEAAGVMHKLADGDLRAIVGKLGDPLPYIIVERQLASAHG